MGTFVQCLKCLCWTRISAVIFSSSRCVLKELESLGKELYGAKLIAQRFQVRNCSHFKNPVSGSACLLSMIEDGNPHHYFIATQVMFFHLSSCEQNASFPSYFGIWPVVNEFWELHSCFLLWRCGGKTSAYANLNGSYTFPAVQESVRNTAYSLVLKQVYLEMSLVALERACICLGWQALLQQAAQHRIRVAEGGHL